MVSGLSKWIANQPPRFPQRPLVPRKPSPIANSTSNNQNKLLSPVEKLVLKEYLFQLNPSQAIKFAKTLKAKSIIDKEGYSEIENCYRCERNNNVRLLTVDKVLEKCPKLSNVVYVLYNSSEQGQEWAKDLYKIYQGRQTQMPVAVQRAPVGNRQCIQDDFIKYKRLLQSLQLQNPIDYLAGFAQGILLSIQEIPNLQKRKLCDQYIVFAALTIDSMANKTNEIPFDNPHFDKINEVIPNTTCPALSRCMLYGRQAVILSFAKDRKRGEEIIKEAYYEEMSVDPCLETVDLYYKIVLYQRAWYEHEQETITSKIHNLTNKACHILASKQEDIRLFWSRRFVVRLLYCYLGIGMRGRFITGFECSEEIIKESNRLLSCYDTNDAELRLQMFFNIAKARLFHLTGNRLEAVECIAKASKIASDGGFNAELNAIEETKLQLKHEFDK